jgi:hypothetical protein
MRVLPCFTTDSDTANTSHLSPAHDDVGPSGHVVTLSTQLLEVYAGHRFYRTRCRYRGPWDGRGHSIPIPGSDIYSGRETGREWSYKSVPLPSLWSRPQLLSTNSSPALARRLSNISKEGSGASGSALRERD